MCGIIASFRTQYNKGKEKIKPGKVNQNIINQFEDQHSRGTEGFGIIKIDGNNKIKIDRACETAKFIIDLYGKPSKMIIAHHRKPTSTDNKLDQTHPIKISNECLKKDYLVIHNGIISNSDKLKKEHKEFLEFNYNTEYFCKYNNSDKVYSKFNDSESLAIELALFIENKSTKINTDSDATFIVLQINKKTEKAEKVYFGRNGHLSDLRMSKTRGCLDISSEGKGNQIKRNKLYSFDIKDKKMKLTKRNLKFDKDKIIKKPKETWKEWEKNQKTTSLLKNNSQISKKETKKEDTEKSPYREWIINPEEIEKIESEITEHTINKNHLSDCNESIASFLKQMTTEEILTETEAALEDQIKFIEEITDKLKQSLMLYKLDKKEIEKYIADTATVIRTMSKITDTAEKGYRDTGIEEEMEEYQTGIKKDIKEYNSLNPKNYDDTFLNDIDYLKEEELEHNYYNQKCGFRTF